MEINEELIAYVAQDPTQPAWVLGDIAANPEHPLAPSLDDALRSVDAEMVERTPSSRVHPSWASPENAERSTRLHIVVGAIRHLLYERRKAALQSLDGGDAPPPYGHTALAGTRPDIDYLVPVSVFERQAYGFRRAGQVFHLPPTLPAGNSSYWLAMQLHSLPSQAQLRVRLDPFIVCSASDYRPASYYMVVYGRPLDWDRLAALKGEEHAEWLANSPDVAGGVSSTQLTWTPRNDGIHFKCEELPAHAGTRPARYIHAIYNPEIAAFTHFDGALRYYTDGELIDRERTHVRKAGKQGRRVKLFLADGVVPRSDWCNVVAAFFVWNEDIQGYFMS